MSVTWRVALFGVLTGASLAWPCSGDVCDRSGEFVTLDGGVPSNFLPLVLTDLWIPNFSSGGTEVCQSDGGAVLTQVRVADEASVVIDTPPLVEGARYELRRPSGCPNFFTGDAGSYVHAFRVVSPVPMPTQGVSIEVANTGSGLVNQYSGSTCSEGVLSSFADFRFVVSPAMGPLLRFYAWTLALEPVGGGATRDWRTEPIGALLEDGALRSVPNASLAPLRISTVFHACGGLDSGFPVSAGMPAGQYRARLTARLLATDSGFVSVSPVFELAPCAGEPPIEPFDGGVDAGTGAVDAGPQAGQILGPAVNRGCVVTPAESLLFLAALGLVRRRRTSR